MTWLKLEPLTFTNSLLLLLLFSWSLIEEASNDNISKFLLHSILLLVSVADSYGAVSFVI